MTDNNVKSKWRIDSIAYSGTGDIPLFILRNGDKIRFIPIERGITKLDTLIDLEEE